VVLVIRGVFLRLADNHGSNAMKARAAGVQTSYDPLTITNLGELIMAKPDHTGCMDASHLARLFEMR